MSAQKRDRDRNYIGLPHEETDERRIADLSAAAKYPTVDHILDLVAALFGRRGVTR
ncbi:hypothetical protein [Bradyrhizobium sp. CB3481]|uniref:hypothetical protein n=1 Tax=Bradyrhizobium sp. CB3481 TaxID=3039158 RepID=UPI0024B22097|nr:hypothetical protein [Bradyrhizobium sp. CB3481]WFU19196.1 hypothetical protein QA643_13010 [Bradyrhizobium sp. CB3481]